MDKFKQIEGLLAHTRNTTKKITASARGKLDQLQRGEDYETLFSTNPMLIDSLARAPLLIENRELLSSAFNLPWTTAALWTAATGVLIELNRPIAHALGGLAHYGPGHVAQWADVNRYMDAVAGSGHRLKYGHSISFLPEIVERFGIQGVPAFFCHLLQDLTTVDGLPVIPNAWNIKQSLMIAGIAPKTATALVSLSASHVLAGLVAARMVWSVWTKLERNKRLRALLNIAEDAAQNRDYAAAIESYKRTLELHRSPGTLMALGQIYHQRASTRQYAHRAFADVVQMIGSEPSRTVVHDNAQFSLRGLAGLQALATADAIGDRYPELWQERVEDLINATVHSFASAGAQLQQGSRPCLLSAALNYYLAAQTACQYPLLDSRQEIVTRHITTAVALIGQVAQACEATLQARVEQLRTVWVRKVLPVSDADLVLATT